ncbi:MAG: type I pantothenate kinase, partial [Streptomyces sp.]
MPTKPYVDLSRAEWSALRERTPLPLNAAEVEELRGLGDVVDLDEVRDIFLPLSRLLNLYVGATHGLRDAVSTFLGDAADENGARHGTPFVIGVAGSVAVGKSTVSRLLRALLARWPEHPRVELVTTDGFLLPKAELEARGLLSRKGFPESYDRRALTRFVADVKAGKPEVTAPVYSHLLYDRLPGERLTVRRPDILIVEGLNVLQPALPGKDGRTRLALADYFDFSVYVDARTRDIEEWYLRRFRALRETAFQN